MQVIRKRRPGQYLGLSTLHLSRRGAPTMQTTTTDPFPDVAPPPGTDPDVWEGDPPQRVVMGKTWRIAGHDITVWTGAIQYADGSLRQPAEVHVVEGEDDEMTSAQARKLAAQRIAAA